MQYVTHNQWASLVQTNSVYTTSPSNYKAQHGSAVGDPDLHELLLSATLLHRRLGLSLF